MAAQPHPPAVVVDEHDGVLHGELAAPRVDDGAPATGQRGRGVGVEGLDPPVLGTRCGTAEVEPPPTLGSADQGRSLQGCRAERLAPDLRHRLEPHPVDWSAPPRPRPRGRRPAASQAVGQPDGVRRRRAPRWRPRPSGRAAAGRRHDDLAVGARQRDAAHPPRLTAPRRRVGSRRVPAAHCAARVAALARAAARPGARAIVLGGTVWGTRVVRPMWRTLQAASGGPWQDRRRDEPPRLDPRRRRDP